MLFPLLFCLTAVCAFGCCIVTSLQLVEFLSSQSINSSSLLAAGFAGGGCGALFMPLLLNLIFLALFVIQHSAMASVPWKKLIQKLALHPIDRSLYILATCLTLQWIMSHYNTLLFGVHLWLLDTRQRPWLWLLFCVIHSLCWLTIYACALLMDVAELLGLKQVYYYLVKPGQHPLNEKARETQSLYRHLRHPGHLCLLGILWLHPVMSISRLFLALVFSLYALFGQRVKPHDREYLAQQLQGKAGSLHRQFSLIG